ncbi:hypothetical protein D0Z07_4206 [Hyphodiscus hymeniophilus]|uniref:Monopolin complex subunit Csm1/Pcs1 C-terminal domain-containing protein n=1 Tax=Hyphodiscus hymeniophilus TaxID=353542 RepID=A0A9P7AXD3_9HELO|nr:hypothetical protein D0Z07_4206 [Hyphodiscus hymeniophilus]
MSRSKYGHSTLSGLIDSDSDDSQFVEVMPTPESTAERLPAKKARGQPKLGPSKVTKSKAPARRLSGRLMSKSKPVKILEPAPAKSKRKALADKTNQQLSEETEEVDEFQIEVTEMGDDLDATVIAIKENKPRSVNKKAPSGRGVTKKRAPTKRAVSTEKSQVVLESQVPEAEMEDTRVEEDIEKLITKPIHASRPRERSHQRQPSVHRRRAGSTSDAERSDPVLRRKLGDLTKKHESLSVKYQDLREIGLREAEQNFERYRKQKEQDKAASEKLIASLKDDAAANVSSTKEARDLRKKIQSQTGEISALQTQIAQLRASVAETQSENHTLSAKLAANRSAAADTVGIKAPGTAAKPNGGIRAMGATDAAAQLKENLYSDLTGLIIRSVKQESEDDVFDCIQTGRNGRALHFKLAVTNDKNESYDDATCSYVPQLDPSRDKDLIELLPDYLVEEISFPRPQAARFYARVGKALTEQA